VAADTEVISNILMKRHLLLRTGVIDFANGSALVERAYTSAKVLACVKLDVVNRKESAEGFQVFDVSVDCSTLEAQEEDSSQRRFRDVARTLSNLVEEQLQEAVANRRDELLFVLPDGSQTWLLNVDVVCLGSDGNLEDLVAFAVFCALKDSKQPQTEVFETEEGGHEFRVDSDPLNAIGLPKDLIKHLPLRISLAGVADSTTIADPSNDEENCVSSLVSVLVNRKGQICSSKVSIGKVKLANVASILLSACQIAGELFGLVDQTWKAGS